MTKSRKSHTAQIKMKVALEAIRGEKTNAEIASKYGVHVTQINTWKKKALEIFPEAFSRKRQRADDDQQALIDDLYQQIGRLTMERDWLKKKSGAL